MTYDRELMKLLEEFSDEFGEDELRELIEKSDKDELREKLQNLYCN